MRYTHWIRIVLCGIVAGVVWFLLSAVSLSLFAQDFVVYVRTAAPYPRWDGVFFFAIDLMMGIWAMWLYSAIAPRYGAKATTAATAGVAWWTLKSLQSAKWVGVGFAPQAVVLIPLATTLVAIVVATVVGAWLYDRVDGLTAIEPLGRGG